MPEDLRIQVGRPAERRRFRVTDMFILTGLVIVLIGQFVNFQQNKTIQHAQRDGRIRTYVSRAITCDEIKGLGLHEPSACHDKVLAKYRDKSTSASTSTGATKSTLTLKVVCDFLRQQVRRDPTFFVLPADCVAP